MLGAEAPPGTTNCAYLKQPDKQESASRLDRPSVGLYCRPEGERGAQRRENWVCFCLFFGLSC